MGKEYKLVKLTEEEIKNNTRSSMALLSCSKCIANNNSGLCEYLIENIGNCMGLHYTYFIEVETDEK